MTQTGAPAQPIVLVTGLSGAGKASILRVLEDLRYETVDNPPLDGLEALVDGAPGPLAAGIDTRTRGFAPALALATLARLRRRPELAVRLVFATAERAVLLRRYTETRRRHPLADPGPGADSGVSEGIRRERALLEPLQEAADWLFDTSGVALPELRRMVESRFRPADAPGLAISVVSFGFPKGLPREADLVFDLRFLRNPHYDTALRPLTGHAPAVAAFVQADPGYAGFWQRLTGFLDPLLPCYVAEGKKYLTIGLGCTGGRHRSVLVAERLVDHLRASGWRAEVTHREFGSTGKALCSPGVADSVAPNAGREAQLSIPSIAIS
jgi:RNase adapter protein RapZ